MWSILFLAVLVSILDKTGFACTEEIENILYTEYEPSKANPEPENVSETKQQQQPQETTKSSLEQEADALLNKISGGDKIEKEKEKKNK